VPFRPVIRRKASCACGGGCPTCSDDLLKHIQPKLTVSTPGDRHEQEADDVADRVLRMPADSTVLSSTFSLQRPESHDTKLKRELKTDDSTGVGKVATDFTSRLGAGAPLDTASRRYFEPRFGQSFDNVRIHNGPEAAAAAATVKARAFTLGNDIVFGAGEHRPESQHGKRLLAHELTHVLQQPASPQTIYRDEDPAAVLPTQAQHDRIMEIFNPQQSAGEAEAVDDPVAFKDELVAVGDTLRTASMTQAVPIRDAPVVLSETDLTDVTAIAESEVRTAVGSALSPSVDLTAVRNSIKYIPTTPGTSPAAGEATLPETQLGSLDLSAVRIKVSQSTVAQAVITRHHVQPGGRDRDLYNQVLRDILARGPADWRTIALTFRGWNTAIATLVQRRIVPESGEAEEQARRRGRWLNLGTSIHEILHAVTHRDFTTAIRALEKGDLGVEGFTEFFTRRIYEDIATRAASDDPLRLRIEGTAGPAFTPPPRTSYTDFFNTVTGIFHLLGDNIENMRQAYFRGRVEYLGLGTWNALAHDLPVFRGNSIGAAILLRTSGSDFMPQQSLVRVSYGRLVWGYSGSVQVDFRAGLGLTYLSEGNRFGIGPEASVTLRGSHLFLEGGALIEGGGSVVGPGNPQLDALFNVGAGAQFGRFQIGPTLNVLVPVTDRAAADRGTRVFLGAGASFVFGL